MEPTSLPITGLPRHGVSPAVLVCGDPARARRMAERLTNARSLSQHREYHAFQGLFQGLTVTICSHGIGAPGAAICFEELAEAGARQLIRVGTCGGLQPDVQDGDLVVATAAVQFTGYGREVAPPGYPAVADPALTLALTAGALAHDQACHQGIVLTRDLFYPGVTTAATPDYAALSQAGVQAVEMECAALFLVASLRRLRAAAILAVDGNVLAAPEGMDSYQPHRPVVGAAVDRAIDVALAALLTTQ